MIYIICIYNKIYIYIHRFNYILIKSQVWITQIFCMSHTNIYGRSRNILEDGKSDIVICAQNVSQWHGFITVFISETVLPLPCDQSSGNCIMATNGGLEILIVSCCQGSTPYGRFWVSRDLLKVKTGCNLWTAEHTASSCNIKCKHIVDGSACGSCCVSRLAAWRKSETCSFFDSRAALSHCHLLCLSPLLSVAV